MTLTKYNNKSIDLIFTICLTIISLILIPKTIIFMAIVPILLSLCFYNMGFLSYLITLILSFSLALLFLPKTYLMTSLIPLAIISLVFIGVISLRLKTKTQFVLGFLSILLIFSFLFKYQMLMDKTNILNMASELKDMVESAYPISFKLELYENTVALFPSLIGIIGLVYSIFAIKTLRNYLSFKNMGISDIDNLNELRVEKKDLLVILLLMLVIYVILTYFGIKRLYIINNFIIIIVTILLINGIFVFDYSIENSKLPLNGSLKWFFLIILFQILVIPLAIIGFLDVFMDFRKRKKDAKKWKVHKLK